VTADAFSIENGLLTPTMKSKRPQLRKHYADIIARLYVEAKASGA
jgi:long-chain acyl-CoA synthetase